MFFWRKSSLEWMIWGSPYFWKPPYVYRGKLGDSTENSFFTRFDVYFSGSEMMSSDQDWFIFPRKKSDAPALGLGRLSQGRSSVLGHLHLGLRAEKENLLRKGWWSLWCRFYMLVSTETRVSLEKCEHFHDTLRCVERVLANSDWWTWEGSAWTRRKGGK